MSIRLHLSKIIVLSILSGTCSVCSYSQNSLEKYFYSDTVFPVFKFTKNSTGILKIIFEDENRNTNPLDSFLSKIVTDEVRELIIQNDFSTPAIQLIDTSSKYHLYYIKTVEDSLRFLLNKKVYVYSAKGWYTSKITNIWVYISECYTNFIFLKLQKTDAQNGQSLFATFKKESINIKRNMVIEKEYVKYLAENPPEYADQRKPVHFAKWKNYQLFYSDDFQFYKKESTTLFPYRRIIKKDKPGIFQTMRNNELDLFGIPCD